MNSLVDKIKKIKKLGIIGIKHSLEDESSNFEDLQLIKKDNLKRIQEINLRLTNFNLN
tara:strand:- start:689 stop:862 length:174 start_codon:yes stop_codon:yes gene_type:complete